MYSMWQYCITYGIQSVSSCSNNSLRFSYFKTQFNKCHSRDLCTINSLILEAQWEILKDDNVCGEYILKCVHTVLISSHTTVWVNLTVTPTLTPWHMNQGSIWQVTCSHAECECSFSPKFLEAHVEVSAVRQRRMVYHVQLYDLIFNSSI